MLKVSVQKGCQHEKVTKRIVMSRKVHAHEPGSDFPFLWKNI